MFQNRSAAVMAQRHEPHDSLDDFPTPLWATRAVLKYSPLAALPRSMVVREPCANRGFMVAPLKERFNTVDALDVHDYGAGFRVDDYLLGRPDPVDLTFINPPFRLGIEFVEQALASSRVGVALFARTAFIEGQDRFARLYQDTPPTMFLPFSERVLIVKGRLLSPDRKYWMPNKDGGEDLRKVTSATSYSWFVWLKDAPVSQQEFRIIPPCRSLLERAEDPYDPEERA